MNRDLNDTPGQLSEQDIRPKELMQDQQVAMLTDVGRLLSRRKEFISVPCPACDARQYVHKFEKRGLDYVECTQCETMYMNPRPGPEVLQWFYRGSENYAYWNNVIFPASEKARRERIMLPRVNELLSICKKYGIETNSLLEVGAGFGTFCVELQSRKIFKRVVAVEPTPDLANTCRKKGLETIELPIEKISFQQTELFNVVVNFEVVEHLFSPRDFVKQIYRVLQPCGILVLSCPNGKGFDVQTLGSISDTIDHEHLNYFNPRSLSLLLESCGYTVLETFTPGKLDAELVRNKVLDNRFDISQQPFLQRVLIDEWERSGTAFQEFLAQQGLSSNMWIIARRDR